MYKPKKIRIYMYKKSGELAFTGTHENRAGFYFYEKTLQEQCAIQAVTALYNWHTSEEYREHPSVSVEFTYQTLHYGWRFTSAEIRTWIANCLKKIKHVYGDEELQRLLSIASENYHEGFYAINDGGHLLLKEAKIRHRISE